MRSDIILVQLDITLVTDWDNVLMISSPQMFCNINGQRISWMVITIPILSYNMKKLVSFCIGVFELVMI